MSLVKNAIEKNNVTEKEVKLLKSIGKNFKEDLHTWCDYNNSNFLIAEQIYQKGRDYFITMMDVGNAAYRLGEYMTKENITKNIINIGGNATGIKLQQGDGNSMQISNESNANYDKILDILYEMDGLLKKNKPKENDSDNFEEIKKMVLETIHMVEQKEKPIKVKKELGLIKKIAVGITENVISNQMIDLVTQLLANI